MTSADTDDVKRADIQLQRNSQPGYVQMKREDYSRIKNNFSLLKAKHVDLLRKNQAMQNLYTTLSEKDEDLKVYKSQAHKYELAYIRAETNLTRVCMRLRQQTGDKSLDISALLQALDDGNSSIDSGLHISSIPKHVEQTDTVEKTHDIEVDGVSNSLPSESDGTERLVARTVDLGDMPMHAALRDENVIKRILHENQLLKAKVLQFESNSEAWAKFKTHDEQTQLIEELRLELARVQVQNHELKLLLQAKQNNNIDALTSKLGDRLTQCKKLEKQLLSKQAVLNALERDYKRVKVEYEKLSRLQEMDPGFYADGTRTASVKDSVDSVYNSTEVVTLEQEVIALKEAVKQSERELSHVNRDKQHLVEQIEEYRETIKNLRECRTTMDDRAITMTMLREENGKLRERIVLFQKEQEQEKTSYSILEGQMNIIQGDLEAAKQRLNESAHLYKETDLLQEKNRKLLEDRDRERVRGDQLDRVVQRKTTEIVGLNQEISLLKQDLGGRRHTPPGGNIPRSTSHDTSPAKHSPFEMSSTFLQPIQTDGLSIRKEPNVSEFADRKQLEFKSMPVYPSSIHADAHFGVRHEMPDGDATASGGSGAYQCERCLRDFESHEEHKYMQHIKKCQD